MLEIKKKISTQEYDNWKGNQADFLVLKPDGELTHLVCSWGALFWEHGMVHKRGWKILRKLSKTDVKEMIKSGKYLPADKKARM